MKKQAQFAAFPGPEGPGARDLTLTQCGYQVCPPGSQLCSGKQGFYSLYALRSGRASCQDVLRLELEAQDLVLVFPGQERTFTADSREGCTWLWVSFTGARAEEWPRQAGFSRQKPCRRSKYLHLMEQLLDQALAPEGGLSHELRAEGYFLHLLAELMDEMAIKSTGGGLSRQSRGPRTSEYVKNAIDYLSKHYSQNIKIQELADLVGINRSYFASSFKKATGESPKEYLLRLRMEKARSLLETSEIPIGSISSAVGYEDPLAFSRIFKRYCGFSPTDYRENHKSRFD